MNGLVYLRQYPFHETAEDACDYWELTTGPDNQGPDYNHFSNSDYGNPE